jgi:hypothetical protein
MQGYVAIAAAKRFKTRTNRQNAHVFHRIVPRREAKNDTVLRHF